MIRNYIVNVSLENQNSFDSEILSPNTWELDPYALASRRSQKNPRKRKSEFTTSDGRQVLYTGSGDAIIITPESDVMAAEERRFDYHTEEGKRALLGNIALSESNTATEI